MLKHFPKKKVLKIDFPKNKFFSTGSLLLLRDWWLMLSRYFSPSSQTNQTTKTHSLSLTLSLSLLQMQMNFLYYKI